MFGGQASMKADSFTTLNYSRKMFGSQPTDTNFHKMFMSVTYCMLSVFMLNAIVNFILTYNLLSILKSSLLKSSFIKDLSTKKLSSIELSTIELSVKDPYKSSLLKSSI
jgi:hypothetical protein